MQTQMKCCIKDLHYLPEYPFCKDLINGIDNLVDHVTSHLNGLPICVINRGSYMIAHVSLILFNKLGKKI